MRKRILAVLGLAVGLLAGGCAVEQAIVPPTTPPPDPNTLRVGITPDIKPMVFRENGQLQGIEIDFARKLGEALHKKIVFVEVPWEKQIDYLEGNKIDIIMSGMSITPVRGIRIAFTRPYMQSGLTALFRRDSFDPAGLEASVLLNRYNTVGYIKNTTSELFVQNVLPRAKKKGYSSVAKAVKALKAGRIKMLVYDAPVLWWVLAQNENELVGFPNVLNLEPLAWAVRKDDQQLLQQINALLMRWEQDGSSEKIIRKWIPFFNK